MKRSILVVFAVLLLTGGWGIVNAETKRKSIPTPNTSGGQAAHSTEASIDQITDVITSYIALIASDAYATTMLDQGGRGTTRKLEAMVDKRLKRYGLNARSTPFSAPELRTQDVFDMTIPHASRTAILPDEWTILLSISQKPVPTWPIVECRKGRLTMNLLDPMTVVISNGTECMVDGRVFSHSEGKWLPKAGTKE